MSIDGGLRALFRKNLPSFDWCSVESASTGGGIPDSNFCTRVTGIRDYGVEAWVEFKQTPGCAVTLRPAQVGWIARRVRCGGRVHIAVRQQAPAGPRRQARDALWLVPGRLAVLARTGGLKALEREPGVLVWGDGPASWDWAAVAAALVE